ncbi:MAG: sortase [bacterium]|nr:sortase [bacterium]
MKNSIARSLSFMKMSKSTFIITVVATVVVLFQVQSFVAPLFSQAKPKQVIPEVTPVVTTGKDEAIRSVPFQKINEPGKPKRFIVPSLSMGLPIVSVPLKNDTWPVEEGVANFAEESSAFNGDTGNSVLFGHNKPDAFRPLNKLKVGESVYVQTSQYQFSYEVKDISTTNPKNIDVMKPGDKYELTLITCNGFFDEKRLIIKAELKEITQLN